MKIIFYHLLRALLVWGTAPDGREWSATADAIFTRDGL